MQSKALKEHRERFKALPKDSPEKIAWRETLRLYRLKNKDRINLRFQIHRIKNVEWLQSVTDTSCCACGYNKTFVAIDFHHYVPKNGDMKQSLGIALARSLPTFQKWWNENKDKGEFRCANCHRELHWL